MQQLYMYLYFKTFLVIKFHVKQPHFLIMSVFQISNLKITATVKLESVKHNLVK